MSDPQVQRDLGRLEASQQASNNEIKELRTELKEMREDLQSVLLVLQERKGGTKYLFLLLTVAATIGGIVDRLIAWQKLF